MKAFEKACKLLEDYQAQHSDEIKEPERESVLAKLKSYDEAAKNQQRKTSAKNRGKEESL